MKERKIEVHRFIISGLPDGLGYTKFLQKLFRETGELSDRIYERNNKSHALKSLSVRNSLCQLKFISFARGFRPDILNTLDFQVEENPLAPHQTGVEWTHALGGLVNNRYLLLIERNKSGLYPSTMERYLQWLIDRFYENQEDNEDMPITVNLEQETTEEFIQRMDSLERIRFAKVRYPRPNPGWKDLENALGEQSDESDSDLTEISMTAKRGNSLARGGGIIAAIRKQFNIRELFFASIEGYKDDKKESFSTRRLGKYQKLNFELDDRGQVQSSDAWNKLLDMFRDLK